MVLLENFRAGLTLLLEHVTCQVPGVMCQVSGVTCHVLCINVLCHMSLNPTATATDPRPANSPIMHTWVVCKDPKTQNKFKMQKIIETSKTQKCIKV